MSESHDAQKKETKAIRRRLSPVTQKCSPLANDPPVARFPDSFPRAHEREYVKDVKEVMMMMMIRQRRALLVFPPPALLLVFGFPEIPGAGC
ncbi:hypothetical protein EJ06DRAFT_533575 [Trichodelitschia bisporula]|uniref:Uncharacterized protein n=1 Tax=Trichodelitschia bisporula TaxID=703511 RepID=A0A6G1HLR2_9PEZI|nr:hypothetical protein EJ06DRAFT_533575 [Trichodelitschia bisporula]